MFTPWAKGQLTGILRRFVRPYFIIGDMGSITMDCMPPVTSFDDSMSSSLNFKLYTLAVASLRETEVHDANNKFTKVHNN